MIDAISNRTYVVTEYLEIFPLIFLKRVNYSINDEPDHELSNNIQHYSIILSKFVLLNLIYVCIMFQN